MSIFHRSFILFFSSVLMALSLCISENPESNYLGPAGLNFINNELFRESAVRPAVSQMKEEERPQTDPLCPEPCGSCDTKKCHLPDCKCSDFAIPGQLSPDDTPQMVILTLQNAVNDLTYQGFLNLFEDLKNPNGCPATGTFFASHVYTDHFYVQSLQSKGHEIGDNTVTSTLQTADYWRTATQAVWKGEMKDQTSILRKFANVTSIRGFRAPYLQMGGDNQLSAMKSQGAVPLLKYDASRVSIKFSKSSGGLLWPYSYDNRSTQDCVSDPCPQKCYAGIWEIPLLAFWNEDNTSVCAVLDSCKTRNYNEVFRLLYNRFVDHYNSNRAPFLITMNPAFLTSDFKVKGLKLFLQFLTSYKKVYFVSAGRALDWIQNPTPLSKLTDFEPWKCVKPNPPVCPESPTVKCRYDEKRRLTTSPGFKYTLRSCAITRTGDCPRCYPWVNDPNGKSC